MNTRLLDKIKKIYYGRIITKGMQVIHAHKDANQYPEEYFSDGTWYRTSYTDYRIFPEASVAETCEQLRITIQSDTSTLTEKSSDNKQETILHYFLRNFDIYPNPDNYSYKDMGTASFNPPVPRRTIPEFLEIINSRFNKFIKLIHTINPNIGTQVIAPVLQNEELKPAELFAALKIKDADGNTPLHIGASIPIGSGLISRLQAVLDSLSRLDDTQRLHLLESRGMNNDTILDCAARNENPQVFEAIQKAFGKTEIEKKNTLISE